MLRTVRARAGIWTVCLSLIAGYARGQLQLGSEETPVDPAITAVLKDTARVMFEQYARKDLERYMSFWAPDSPQLERARQAAREAFDSSPPLRLDRMDVVSTILERKDAWVEANVFFTPESGADPVPRNLTRTIVFAKFGGKWQVKFCVTPPRSMGEALAQKSQPQRQEMLQRTSEWEAAPLAAALMHLSYQAAKSGKLDAAHRLDDLICEAGQYRHEPVVVGRCYLSRAGTLETEGNRDQAIAEFKRARVQFHQAGAQSEELSALVNLAGRERSVGQYFEALGEYQEALRIQPGPDDATAEGLLYYGLGRLYQRLNDQEKALAAYRTGAHIAEQDDSWTSKFLAADMHLDAGQILHSQGSIQNLPRLAEAREEFDQAFEIASKLNNKLLLWRIIHFRGQMQDVHCFMRTLMWRHAFEANGKDPVALISKLREIDLPGVCQTAEEHFSLTLQAAEAGFEGDRVVPLLDLGEHYLRVLRPDDALARFREAAQLAEKSSLTGLEVAALVHLGQMEADRQHWPEALSDFRRAASLAEKVDADESGTLPTRLGVEHRQALGYSYVDLVRALLMTGSGSAASDREAFEWSERSKSRILIDLLSRGNASIFGAMTAAEKDRQRTVNAAVAEWDARWSEAQNTQSPNPGIRDQMQQAHSAAGLFLEQLFQNHPELKVQQGKFSPASLAEINRILWEDDRKSALVSFLVGNEDAFAFVLLPGGRANGEAELRVRRLPVTSGDLLYPVDQFYQQCSSEADYREQGHHLYQLLWSRIAPDVKGMERVIVAPHGLLHKVAFQALLDDQGKFLIESHSIVYTPSASALVAKHRLVRARKSDQSGRGATMLPMLAIGHPLAQAGFQDLKASEAEARDIASAFGGTALIGPAATVERAKAEMPRARLIHVAAHVKMDEHSPMHSAIVLTSNKDSGLLPASDIANLSLHADMVVLSACESALGAEVQGEGLVGLAWALFAAGSASTVANLWEVGDESSKTLMENFYRHWRANAPRPSKDSALRQAQLEFLKDPLHRHPKFWAPYVLTGEWSN